MMKITLDKFIIDDQTPPIIENRNPGWVEEKRRPEEIPLASIPLSQLLDKQANSCPVCGIAFNEMSATREVKERVSGLRVLVHFNCEL
jgi:hypothetical protein